MEGWRKYYVEAINHVSLGLYRQSDKKVNWRKISFTLF